MSLGKSLSILVIVIFIAGSLSFIYLRNSITSAKKSLTAFEKLLNSESFNATLELPKTPEKPHLTIEASHFSDKTKLSRYVISVDAQNETNEVSQLAFLVSDRESYVKPHYSDIDSLEKKVKTIYPQYEKLETTKTVLNLLEKDLWLKLPSSDNSEEEEILSKQQSQMFWNKIKDSLIVRSQKDIDNTYTELKIGFNKRKLVNAIEYLKGTNSGFSLKEVNAIKNYIQSTLNWNRDLIVVKINKQNEEIAEIFLYLPENPSILIKEVGFSNPMRFGSSIGPLFTVIPTKIFDVFNKDSNTGLYHIASISISDYGSVQELSKPEEVMEYSVFAKVAQEEVYPVMREYFKNSTESASQNTP